MLGSTCCRLVQAAARSPSRVCWAWRCCWVVSAIHWLITVGSPPASSAARWRASLRWQSARVCWAARCPASAPSLGWVWAAASRRQVVSMLAGLTSRFSHASSFATRPAAQRVGPRGGRGGAGAGGGAGGDAGLDLVEGLAADQLGVGWFGGPDPLVAGVPAQLADVPGGDVVDVEQDFVAALCGRSRKAAG